jgi:hypothetical protein
MTAIDLRVLFAALGFSNDEIVQRWAIANALAKIELNTTDS